MWTLIDGLPPESATWRRGNWSQQDELLALAIENFDRWGRMALLRSGVKRHDLPERFEINHPDRRPEDKQEKKVETDPRRIAAFFRNRAK